MLEHRHQLNSVRKTMHRQKYDRKIKTISRNQDILEFRVTININNAVDKHPQQTSSRRIKKDIVIIKRKGEKELGKMTP